MQPTWQPPSIAAALDQHLVWWRMDSSSISSGSCSDSSNTATCSSAGADEGGSQQQRLLRCSDIATRLCSNPQHGHTAFIDALLELPSAGGSSLGYASGSRDKTVKLWAPFSSGSSSSFRTTSGMVRPVRTLRGHTGSVTALLVLPAGGCRDSSSSSSSSGDGCPPAVLASASADKTVKLWSIASLTPGASSSSSSKSLQQQQQGRNPLLATLRGHSDCVTDLLLPPDSSCSSSCSSRLFSCSRDCRIKLWDVNSQSCVITWKMTSPCHQLLSGLDLGSCIAAVGSHAIMLLDTRIKGGSRESAAAGVLRLQWPSGSLNCAAAYGSMLAGGGRRGVRVWDVRMLPQQHSSGSSNNGPGASKPSTSNAVVGARRAAAAATTPAPISTSSGSSRVLFSAHMPDNEPVTALQLSRVRLVAATSRVALHSAASVTVWIIPEWQRLQRLSSTASAIQLQVLGRAGGAFWQDSEAANDAWELIQALGEADADEAMRIIHQQQQQQQQAEEGLQQQQQQPWFDVLDVGAAEPAVHPLQQHLMQLQQQQQQQQQQAAAAAEQVEAAGSEGTAESEPGPEDASEPSNASGAGASDHDSEAGSHAESAGSGVSSSWGRLEPGAVAVAAAGPVLATVDTLGNILLRDFRRGHPRPHHMQPYCSSITAASTESEAISSSSTGVSSSSNAVGVAGQPRAAAAAAAAEAAAAVVAGGAVQVGEPQPSYKFWRA
uniref:Uncharacterized protein n=1 Tax=Tetradesmus obliquus TaxID=3088 RepID=A0A383W1I9_TETOB|eukprot:jgi/Sobl393_1/4702/SZX71527.1